MFVPTQIVVPRNVQTFRADLRHRASHEVGEVTSRAAGHGPAQTFSRYWKHMSSHSKLKLVLGNLVVLASIMLVLIRGWLSAPLALLFITLIYNFDLGNQKGHYLHMTLICTTGLIVLECYVLNNIIAMYLAGATIAGCIVLFLIKKNDIKQMYADYYASVRRDHFTGTISMFRR